jgi:hypothetical protein
MKDIGMKKGLGIVGLVIIVFGILVVSIVVLDKGCSKLDMGFAPFSGKFEHCAFAAGQATERAVLDAGISEDIARAASSAATESAAESLKEGKSPKEAASAAAAAVFKAADEKGADRDEATRAAAAAGAAVAAAASSTSEDVDIATKKAADAAIRQEGKENLTNETSNVKPVANGGDDQTVSANTQVTLDGSKSIDKDGTLVSYKWKQTHGPKVDIQDSDEAMASFNAPSLSEDSKLVFKLTVTDDQGAPKSDQVSIKVKGNTESQPTGDKNNTESQPIEDKGNTESQPTGDKNNTESNSN